MSAGSNADQSATGRFNPNEKHLYRGTTRGWPGNLILQNQRITCTTTDPLVATLFAIECRNYGQAVILLASRGPFQRLPVPENWFSMIESAVNVGVSPIEFERIASLRLEVDQAIVVLETMGFSQLPQRITGKVALQDALEESYHSKKRLSLEEVEQFNQLVQGETP